MTDIPKEVILYAAGFFDGEGHVRSNHKNATVVIGQVEPAPLYYLQEFFGGQVHRKLNRKNGIYHWTVASLQARTLLIAIRPYLLVKGPDVDDVLDKSYGKALDRD